MSAKATWSGRGPGVATTSISAAAGTDPLAVGELANEVRQVALRPGPGEDRQVEAERERFRAGRVVRIGMGQGDRDEPAAGGRCRGEDRVGGRVRRVARVDDDDLALARRGSS